MEMTAVDGYVCTLDDATQRKAERELNEIPGDRLSAVAALREWVNSQPHLKCRTDTRFLLTFLRGSKFSQLRAREKIEGLMTVTTAIPEWFQNIDTRDPKLQALIEKGYVIPLPKKDKNGCPILLYRMGALDPSTKVVAAADEIRVGNIMGAYCSEDEAVEVNGFVFLFDFTGMTAKHMTRWSMDDIRRWSKCWQNNMPGRFKAFHYYNAGAFFETMMAMMRPVLSKKFQDRTHVHSNLESLYKHLQMEILPDEYLPDDYEGPSAGPLKEIIKNVKQKLTSDEMRNKLLEHTSSKWGVEKSKRVKEEVPSASFRKLNVD